MGIISYVGEYEEYIWMNIRMYIYMKHIQIWKTWMTWMKDDEFND